MDDQYELLKKKLDTGTVVMVSAGDVVKLRADGFLVLEDTYRDKGSNQQETDCYAASEHYVRTKELKGYC